MQIREEVGFTKGRIIVRGKLVTRGKAKRADYVLYYKPNIPLALIEAKDNNHSVGDGMQQALDYAETLDVPFVFSLERRRLPVPRPHRHERRRSRREPRPRRSSRRPADLWARYRAWKGLDAEAEQIVAPGLLRRRQRQGAALLPASTPSTRAIEAIAKGAEPRPARHGDRHRQDLHRVPDHLAAVEGGPQEAHPVPRRPQHPRSTRRWSTTSGRSARRWRSSAPTPRPSSAQDGTTVELPTALDKKRRIDTAYEIYLGLYQAITGPEERQKLFREFSPGFFDLIVDRRVPPRQRRRGFGLARNPRLLLRRHADRPDRHAEGDRSTSPTSTTSASRSTPTR